MHISLIFVLFFRFEFLFAVFIWPAFACWRRCLSQVSHVAPAYKYSSDSAQFTEEKNEANSLGSFVFDSFISTISLGAA